MREIYFDNKEYNVAFSRCINTMMELIQKYGPMMLKEWNSAIPFEYVICGIFIDRDKSSYTTKDRLKQFYRKLSS